MGGAPPDEERWHALRVKLDDEERAAVDEALQLAGELMPGSTRADRVEALAQEFFASCTLGVGQFCTNPGVVVVPRGEAGELCTRGYAVIDARAACGLVALESST